MVQLQFCPEQISNLSLICFKVITTYVNVNVGGTQECNPLICGGNPFSRGSRETQRNEKTRFVVLSLSFDCLLKAAFTAGQPCKKGGENIHIKQSNPRPHSLTQRENEEVHSNYHGRRPRCLCGVGLITAKLADVEVVARALWTSLVFTQGDFRSQLTSLEFGQLTAVHSAAAAACVNLHFTRPRQMFTSSAAPVDRSPNRVRSFSRLVRMLLFVFIRQLVVRLVH